MPNAIAAASTSVAAFIGYTAQGPTNQPIRVDTFADFEAQFGGIDVSSDTSYAVAQFFANGGGVAWVVRVVGADDPAAPSTAELLGDTESRTGLHALDGIDLINILAIPNRADPALYLGMIAYAEQRRAFAILDMPGEVKTLADAKAWVLSSDQRFRSRNAAAYFPRLLASDPAQSGQVRSFANSGAIAGLFARIDGTFGVWKAPAGVTASLAGITGLECAMTSAEQGILNPLGLNALRSFPAQGNVVWGARTLVGADTLASEWKYIPVRRMALLIEQSLQGGLTWVVFEPNAEPLWAEIRLSAGAFMQSLFRQGAFQGQTPREGYFVKCDRDSTSQADVDAGIINLVVGFAPTKPAEFVVLRFSFRTRG